MKPGRRDPPRRVTPELIDFHVRRAHQLRIEAWRNTWRGLSGLLVRLTRYVRLKRLVL
jgi:hypothetical protein